MLVARIDVVRGVRLGLWGRRIAAYREQTEREKMGYRPAEKRQTARHFLS